MNRYIVIDVETTGLHYKKDRIIQISCVEIVNGSLTGNLFNHYIKSPVPIKYGAYKIHGITDESLINKPSFNDIIDRLISFIGKTLLVAHNASFDAIFLKKEFKLLKKPFPFKFIDTLTMARFLFPGKRNNLLSLIQRFNIKPFNELHNSLSDAFCLALCFIKMINIYIINRWFISK